MARLRYFARETLVSLQRNLMMTIAAVLTVAVSLALFGGSMMLSRWVGAGTEDLKQGVRAEIFMKIDATDQQTASVQAKLDSDPDIRNFRFLDHDLAYAEFKRLFKDQPALVTSVRPKDLPTSFRIAPKQAELTEVVQRRYAAEAGVDLVKTPEEALEGLLEVTDIVQKILFALSAVLLLSSLFLIVNTIRLATFARRREIEVMRLVGASNWFIRIPFLAEGVLQGIFGAGIAVGVVFVLKFAGFDNWFQEPGTFFSKFDVTSNDVMVVSVLVVVAGSVIGLAGSLFGLRRFLRT
jgi:cell division transport system permease protein